MRIVLVGAKGVGKTTICRKVVEMARRRGLRCVGTITSQQGDDLLVEDVATGEKKLLAAVAGSHKVPGGIPHCHFVFSPEGIEFGKRALSKRGDLLVIDEFGKLELMGKGFDNALEAFKRHGRAVLAAQDTLKDRLLQELDGVEFKVVEATEQNREELPQAIIGCLDAHR
ncbi:MAG: nucleoside-triphosphatase [Candidatus Hadarchaeum sp.]|uniref:nucleoside-triphosphatase n=1 Tax=Candidatus Hadarchaeum sp. TaxID=2883567 RepID=UPI003D0EAB78